VSTGDTLDQPPSRRGRTTVVIALGAVVGVAALLLTAVLAYRAGGAGRARATPSGTPRPSPSASRTPTTAEVYTAVAPSVVRIQAAPAGGTIEAGTGVVVNGDGTIMTALHVVKGASRIQVAFADGTTSTAQVTGADPALDVAVLRPATLPSIVVPAVLGSSNRLAVGDGVVAIGNQLGLAGSTTTGVVSGLGRQAKVADGTSLSGLIQFDAAVNPGSSGGPLLNARGETVGIVVALANPTGAGTFVGVGFAVPIGAAVGGAGGSRAPQQ
jgi:putative serine protease PepD